MLVKIRTKYKTHNKIWNNIQKSTLSKILSLVSSGFVGSDFKFNLVHYWHVANAFNVF